jgi:beta-galactosidase
MIKQFYFLFIAILFFLNGIAQPIEKREKINFDDDWKFHFGNASDPAKDFNYGITAIFSKSGKTDGTALGLKFNDINWRKLDLHHDWAVSWI